MPVVAQHSEAQQDHQTPGAVATLRDRLPAFGDDGDFCLLQVEPLEWRPGSLSSLQYRLVVQSRSSGHEDERLLVLWRGDPERLARMARACRRRLPADGPEEPFACFQAEKGSIILPFPIDHRLPSLPEALDPLCLEKRLRDDAEFLLTRTPLSQVRIDCVRYIPGRRCQLHFRFRQGPDRKSFLGKVFKDDRGRPLADRMQAVAELFEANGDPLLTAPRPLGYWSDWRMTLQEHLLGATLWQSIRNGEVESWQLRRSAALAAVLHGGSQMNLDARHGCREEGRLIARAASTLNAQSQNGLCPSLPQGFLKRVEDALEALLLEGATMADSPLVPVHRDYYDKQLLLNGERAALIDLDTLARGPAEIDLANFTAHIRLRALQGHLPSSRVESLQFAFLAEYQRRTKEPIKPRLFSFLQRTTFFRLACHYALQPRQTTTALERLLDLSRSREEIASATA